MDPNSDVEKVARAPEKGKALLKNVFTELFPAKDSWFNIGLQLDVSVQDLKEIERNCETNGDRLRDMLIVRTQAGDLLWEQVVEVLENCTVGQAKLAETVQSKYVEPLQKQPVQEKIVERYLPPVEPITSPPEMTETESSPVTEPSNKTTTRANLASSVFEILNEDGYFDEMLFVRKKTIIYERYRCKHCKRIPRLMYKCQCGKKSCGNCKQLSCSACESVQKFEPDAVSNRNVIRLRIKCPHEGCEQHLRATDLDKHIRDRHSRRSNGGSNKKTRWPRSLGVNEEEQESHSPGLRHDSSQHSPGQQHDSSHVLQNFFQHVTETFERARSEIPH